MTIVEEKQNEIDALADREAQLDALLRELWDSREPISIYSVPTGGQRLHADSDQAQRIKALLGLKGETE